MPDWVTHIAVAYSIAVLAGVKNRELAVLGALLPDTFKAFIPLGAYLGYGQLFFMGNYFAPFHTVLGITLSSALVSTFFPGSRKVLPLFLLGAATHLVMDGLLHPFGYENWFLWPFLTFEAEGIIWPDSLYNPVAALSILTLILWRRKIAGEHSKG